MSEGDAYFHSARSGGSEAHPAAALSRALAASLERPGLVRGDQASCEEAELPSGDSGERGPSALGSRRCSAEELAAAARAPAVAPEGHAGFSRGPVRHGHAGLCPRII